MKASPKAGRPAKFPASRAPQPAPAPAPRQVGRHPRAAEKRPTAPWRRKRAVVPRDRENQPINGDGRPRGTPEQLFAALRMVANRAGRLSSPSTDVWHFIVWRALRALVAMVETWGSARAEAIAARARRLDAPEPRPAPTEDDVHAALTAPHARFAVGILEGPRVGATFWLPPGYTGGEGKQLVLVHAQEEPAALAAELTVALARAMRPRPEPVEASPPAPEGDTYLVGVILTEEEQARVDRLAEARGVDREAMLVELTKIGLEEARSIPDSVSSIRLRAFGLTREVRVSDAELQRATGAANDSEPPPSGER